tara:strand:- start:815 stop:1099 length:285 start_codon:yes stop_codon:yes gene_type:complete
MKITSQDIKEMILRELTDLVSTQDDTYGTQRDFETSPFQNYSRVIRENASKMVEILQSSDSYDRKALVDFKERELPDLHLALDAVENKITDLLS